MASLDTRWRYR